MEKMSEADEKRVYGALEHAINMVNKGSTPDDAIYKVACDEKFMPQFVQRMCEAFNVSKSLSHFKTAEAVEKAATFPLASSTAILNRMYPERVVGESEKQAQWHRPTSYNIRETINFNKLGQALPPLPRQHVTAYAVDEKDLESRRWAKRAGLVKRAEVARGDARMRFYELMKLAGDAGEHFKLVTHVPFAEAEVEIVRAYGQLGKSAMDMIHHFADVRDKRATVEALSEKCAAWFDKRKAPYIKIAELIEASKDFFRYTQDYANAQVALENFEEKTATFVPTRPEDSSLLGSVLGHNKEAAGPSFLGAAPGQAANIGLSILGLNPNKSEDSVRRSAISDVHDPIHESKLNGYKAQAVLNDLLSNDEVLSEHNKQVDPRKMMDAFNSVTELTPGVAQQPALMRGVLRRMLSQDGVMEPFEAQQLTAIERSLKGMAPDAAGAPAKQ